MTKWHSIIIVGSEKRNLTKWAGTREAGDFEWVDDMGVWQKKRKHRWDYDMLLVDKNGKLTNWQTMIFCVLMKWQIAKMQMQWKLHDLV